MFRRWGTQSVEEIYASELAQAAEPDIAPAEVRVPSRPRRLFLKSVVGIVFLGALLLLGAGLVRMVFPTGPVTPDMVKEAAAKKASKLLQPSR